MTEAEHLRIQAERFTQLANEATDKSIVDALLGVAAKNLEQAFDLECRQAQSRDHKD